MVQIFCLSRTCFHFCKSYYQNCSSFNFLTIAIRIRTDAQSSLFFHHRPDVAQIDQFKEEICDALTSYSSKIEDYLKEMSDCDQTCNGLRDEIRRLSDYTSQMSANATCVFTEKPVVAESQPFYIFPSGFVALESALKKEVVPYLNDKQKSHMDLIEKEIEEIKCHLNNSTESKEEFQGGSDDMYRLEELQCDLDGLIAAECPLTGSLMIESIDRRFCDSKEDELYIACDTPFAEAYA